MSVESVTSAEQKEAAIVKLFRDADSRMATEGSGVFAKPFTTFCLLYHHFNFAELEQVFRKKDFKTYFLAIPEDRYVRPIAEEEIIFDNFPGQRIVDMYQKMVHGREIPMRYRGKAYPNVEALQKAADAFGIDYDEQSNLARLRVAGGRFVSQKGILADIPQTPVRLVPSLMQHALQPALGDPKLKFRDGTETLLTPYLQEVGMEHALTISTQQLREREQWVRLTTPKRR